MANKLSFQILFLCCWMVLGVFSKTFNDEELAKELIKQGFPKSELNDWACLIKHESSCTTNKLNTNKDGSKDYGLFQLNDHWWCGGQFKGRNGCNIKCDELLKDDITVASKCAKTVKKQQGFSAWVAWVNNCKGKVLTDFTKYVK